MEGPRGERSPVPRDARHTAPVLSTRCVCWPHSDIRYPVRSVLELRSFICKWASPHCSLVSSTECSRLIQIEQWRQQPYIKNAVLWDMMPCGSCKNRCFGQTYRLHHQGEKISGLGTTLAVTRNWSTLRRNISFSPVSPPWKPQILHSLNRLGSVTEA
jgi:hypothetical protein